MRKTLITLSVLLALCAAVVAVGFAMEPHSAVRPVTEDAPCPVTGCANGQCHGFGDVPEPDGVTLMTCPEVGCQSAECHAWDSLVNRYHQASDASLNLWILMPAVLVVGLVLLTGVLSRKEEITQSVEVGVRATRAATGKAGIFGSAELVPVASESALSASEVVVSASKGVADDTFVVPACGSVTVGRKKGGRGCRVRCLAFDGVVLAVYAVAANPAMTGIPLHEYASLVALVVLTAHCAARGPFRLGAGRNAGCSFARAIGRGSVHRAMPMRAAVLSAALNGLLILAMVLCAVSGVMVSGTMLPALGLYAEGYYFWDPLHALSAKLLLALLLIHVALHLLRIITALR